MRSHFTPGDPQAAHARFAKVLERVTKRVEAEIEAERDPTVKRPLIDGPTPAA